MAIKLFSYSRKALYKGANFVWKLLIFIFITGFACSKVMEGNPWAVNILMSFTTFYPEPDCYCVDKDFFNTIQYAGFVARHCLFVTAINNCMLWCNLHNLYTFIELPSVRLQTEIRTAISSARYMASLLDYQQWLNFCLSTLYPLTPWSILYTGQGVYGGEHKALMRGMVWICFKSLALKKDIAGDERCDLFNGISFIMLELSRYIAN